MARPCTDGDAAAAATSCARKLVPCFWSLLSTDFTFLHVDPEYFARVGGHAGGLVSTSLLDYVHPQDRPFAHSELATAVRKETLYGTVIRMRCRDFARLAGVEIGGPEDTSPTTPGERYAVVDLVVNCAAEGVLLCFVHTVEDLWTRGGDRCGTSAFGAAVKLDLQSPLALEAERAGPDPDGATRVLQIVENSRRGRWAELAAGRSSGAEKGGDYAACTRRHKACGTAVLPSGARREVESVFVPYGAVISCVIG
ncbi:uncharacterized protein BXZ73DRAFT_105494 [Epithele typhae]|uniref:uncharacterized protein n=1 Tax=Epithele typhae TaxID=378194 RepID=UPI002007B9F6|nr:uncharacterized protein BXZ73DRAFT_105494 [Epithele typhae]KAH9917672.1 hypothetical protein BXZ73DRAFT_105494 [Epithele typhae]